MTIEEKEELAKICESEFDVFSSAISKMGFDPQGFAFMILFDKKALNRKNLTNRFSNLTEDERRAIDNRVKLLG